MITAIDLYPDDLDTARHEQEMTRVCGDCCHLTRSFGPVVPLGRCKVNGNRIMAMTSRPYWIGCDSYQEKTNG